MKVKRKTGEEKETFPTRLILQYFIYKIEFSNPKNMQYVKCDEIALSQKTSTIYV